MRRFRVLPQEAGCRDKRPDRAFRSGGAAWPKCCIYRRDKPRRRHKGITDRYTIPMAEKVSVRQRPADSVAAAPVSAGAANVNALAAALRELSATYDGVEMPRIDRPAARYHRAISLAGVKRN